MPRCPCRFHRQETKKRETQADGIDTRKGTEVTKNGMIIIWHCLAVIFLNVWGSGKGQIQRILKNTGNSDKCCCKIVLGQSS